MGSERSLVIEAEDGFSLAASLFGDGPGPIVVINSATGVKRQFYRKFAQWLADQGAAVVTYDYRGIGDSGGDQTRKGFRARMRDWALRDAFAVLEWSAREFPGEPICVIGHSFGGQCLGLLKNNGRINRVVLIGAQNGYWGNFPAGRRWRLILLWHVVLPLLTRACGYFPSRRFGLGEDLPAGVALEWARWCRQRDYLMGDLGPELPSYFEQLTCPILAYKIADDDYGPGQAVDELLRWYRRASVSIRAVGPEDFGAEAIGHFGAFRERFRDSLWKEIGEWALRGKSIPNSQF
jgi:predicted alpha/beta hydrolase